MYKYIETINFNIPNINKIKIDIGLSYNVPQSKVWLDHDQNLMVIGFEPNPENILSIDSNEIKNSEIEGSEIEGLQLFYYILIIIIVTILIISLIIVVVKG